METYITSIATSKILQIESTNQRTTCFRLQLVRVRSDVLRVPEHGDPRVHQPGALPPHRPPQLRLPADHPGHRPAPRHQRRLLGHIRFR